MFDYRYEGFIEKFGVSFTLIYLIFFYYSHQRFENKFLQLEFNFGQSKKINSKIQVFEGRRCL